MGWSWCTPRETFAPWLCVTIPCRVIRIPMRHLGSAASVASACLW